MKPVDHSGRRAFLRGILASGAFVLAARFAPDSLEVMAFDDVPAAIAPGLWLSIATDGTVTIIAHRSEMGSGSRTALPVVVADELDADWGRVRLEQAVGDAKYGDQNTDGSHSVKGAFEYMRHVGGAARAMLIQAAALRWKVAPQSCATEDHGVIHRPSGRRATYGELAAEAAKLPVPARGSYRLKSPNEWRYIGRDFLRLYDLQDMVTGRAVYGMDARLPGMVYASIEHPPVLGQAVATLDDTSALAVTGVRQTLTLDAVKPPHVFKPLGGVAVIADNTWAAFKGRKALKVTWGASPHSTYNSDEFRKTMAATARKPGKVVRNVGDVAAVFSQPGTVIEAEYYTPHLVHASMEPPVAVADYRDGKVTVWAPTQNPQAVQETLAEVLGIKKEAVTCHVTLLGGGFGRKSKPDQVAEAALLSKRIGKPVKVVWTREDDIRHGYYHSTAAMYLKAAIGAGGKPTAWLQRAVFPPIWSTFDGTSTYGDAEMTMGWNDVPFDIPNHRAENGPAPHHVRIGWMRSVSNIYQAFAIHSFVDELAHAARRDPVEYLLDLLGPPRHVDVPFGPDQADDVKRFPLETGRLRRVIEIVAERSGWAKRSQRKGHGFGIAAHRSFLTYVASVVEVDVDEKGQVHVQNVWTALDAGRVVHPDNVRNQFEGAAVFGTSVALFGEITASNGAIDQRNFNDYPITRLNRAPRHVDVHIVQSSAPPAGVGEPGVPPIAPAICNAVFAATGKRVRELPLSKAALV